jgi:hypothetical protein
MAGVRRSWPQPKRRPGGAAATGCVSSFTFQPPGFYQKYGYVETGRTLGIPGGGEDVHMFKRL